MLVLPKDKLQAARERVKNLAIRYREQSALRDVEIEHEPRDAEYQRTMAALNGDPLTEGLTGERPSAPSRRREPLAAMVALPK